MGQSVEKGGELRFEHSIQYPESLLTETVYFQVSDDGQHARFIEGRPSIHPNGIWLGDDIDRFILAQDALGLKLGAKTWWPLAEITDTLEKKCIPFRYVQPADEEASLRQEIFQIQILRKTSPRNKKINQRGRELKERLPAVMEGRASSFGIAKDFSCTGKGWLFKPKGYQGAYLGSDGDNRFATADDSFPNKEAALAALEIYVRARAKEAVFLVDRV